MPFPPRPLAGNRKLRRQLVPADSLAQALGRGELRGHGQLTHRNRTLQWLYVKAEALPHCQEQLLEALQSRCLDPALDPTDRVLAGPRPQREAALTEALRLTCFAKGSADIRINLTPQRVSEYLTRTQANYAALLLL
jgi:hypothetical protein